MFKFIFSVITFLIYSILPLGSSFVVMANILPDAFWRLAKSELGVKLCLWLFTAHFGAGPKLVLEVWHRIQPKPEGASGKHLLWAMAFLKMYETEDTAATRFKTTPKTWRKWVWSMLSAIQDLKPTVVRSECQCMCMHAHYYSHSFASISQLCLLLPQVNLQRRMDTDKNNLYSKLTVDGVDFPIEEPSPFHKRWFSHKTNGPALRYEIAISIVGGNICWTNGPFPAGQYADLTIFRRGLMKKLGKDEFVEADHGYKGEPNKIRLPFEAKNKSEIERKGKARARHEATNRLIKRFGALGGKWHHPFKEGQHMAVFEAAVVIVQIGINIGSIKPFKCAAPYKSKTVSDQM